MVKGVTRRVVVIKSPDKDIFDEAIFIVREDMPGETDPRGVDVVMQAQLTADAYIRDNIERRRPPRLPAPVYVAAGALLSGLAMLVYRLCA
ncbi:MAG: translation initiation factor 2 [Oscillospiraceae bacterium]|jgi:hypothetical protein|nr:translation initiation factor 2 [Oscillospiraceae bacterium]